MIALRTKKGAFSMVSKLLFDGQVLLAALCTLPVFALRGV
jgi:hypothetical protein